MMYAQWWQEHSYMCFIVLQYLSFHGYHRNCRFAIQIGRRDSEHQPICYSFLNLILLSWAQTCFSLSGAIMWVPIGCCRSLPLLGCFWGNSVCTLDCPLVLLSVVKFLSREDDLHFDVQPKCLRGCFLSSGWLFCHSPGVKQVSKGIF